jgi:hypothetical protein
MDAATFWTAVGAIGTCVAAVVAVIALWDGTTKGIHLQGRWKGDLGDLWGFDILLRVEKATVQGRIDWKLVECPSDLPWAPLACTSSCIKS